MTGSTKSPGFDADAFYERLFKFGPFCITREKISSGLLFPPVNHHHGKTFLAERDERVYKLAKIHKEIVETTFYSALGLGVSPFGA